MMTTLTPELLGFEVPSEDERNQAAVNLAMLSSAKGGQAIEARELRLFQPKKPIAALSRVLKALVAEGRAELRNEQNAAGVPLEKFFPVQQAV